MSLLPLYAAWAVVTVSPGPDFLVTLRTAAAHGRRHGAWTGLGVVAGIACWAALALTGLAILLARFSRLYLVLRTVGAVFLMLYGLHVAWQAWRSRGEDDAVAAPSATTPWKSFRLGLATNLSNPKAVLFFGALFASVMPPELDLVGKLGAVAGMLLMTTVWYMGLAALAGSQQVQRGYRRIHRGVDGVAGGVFFAIGGALIPR